MDRPLANSDVLLLDCQSTGASPERGHLLEVAWCRTTARAIRAGSPSKIETHLVALPDGERIPRRIAKLTGIRDEDLADADAPETVWRRLSDAFGERVAVAHFARFESAFIAALRREHTDAATPPIEWLCTHEIACRLLPGLPRRGLNAVAGYLGHVMEEGKRAASHVAATAAVWGGLVGLLEREANVTTLGDLREWMGATEPTRRAGRDFAVAREKRLGLPDGPGVYRMLGREGQVLYVGKATSLRHRVNSYFQKRRHPGRRTLEMLTQVFDIDTTSTPTALEAALLECDEIKRLAPPYNVALRGRHTTVSFTDDSLASVSGTPDAAHRHGPLPNEGLSAAWNALFDLLEGCDRDAAFALAIGLSAGAPADPAILREGLAAFTVQYALRNRSRAGFMGLGKRLWREHKERLAEKEEEEAEPEPEEPEERAGEPWAPRDPEQVVRLLETTVRHGAHALRRGRWLRRLLDSDVTWETADGSRRSLVFAAGRVESASDSRPGDRDVSPPGGARVSAFDVATYDRLRVLTTEMRRLVSAGRAVEVRLAAGRGIDTTSLARVLYWL